MRVVLRYRWAVACALAVVSALVTSSTTFAPLFVRALDRAMLTTALANAEPSDVALRLTSTSTSGPAGVRSPTQLATSVPPDVARHLAPAVAGRYVDVRPASSAGRTAQARLLWREDACRHVRLVVGRCPSAPGEVAVAATTAGSADGWSLGRSVEVAEASPAVASTAGRVPTATLRVVGTWTVGEDPWWLGDPLSGSGGPLGALLTTQDTVGGPGTTVTTWRQPASTLDLAVDPARVGPDDAVPLAAAVTAFTRSPSDGSGALVGATSDLPAVVDLVSVGGAQTRVIVPLLMIQLAVLLAVVLWLLAAAATGQRRGEVAVARLRGRGVRGARRLLLGETLPAVLAGIPLGLGAAIGANALLRRFVLPGEAPFELPSGLWVVLAVTAAVLLLLPVLAVRRVSTEPVATLVRSIAPRGAGLAFATVEALVVTAAGASFVGLATRTISGPVATAAPLLLALAVGLVLARVAGLVLPLAGRGLLRRRMPSAAAALVAGSRRGTGRWLVPLVTMSVALVVFALNALGVAARNRVERAEVEVGAPAALTVGTRDVRQLVDAVRAVDPAGRLATPVVELAPADDDAAATYGVDPESFARVATWARRSGAPDLAQIRSTLPPTVEITGRTLTVEGVAGAFRPDLPFVVDGQGQVVPGDPATDRFLPWVAALRLVQPDGELRDVPLGALTMTAHPIRVEVAVPCADGCSLVGFSYTGPVQMSTPIQGDVTISSVAVDGRAVAFGRAEDYRSLADPSAAQPPASPTGTTFTVRTGDAGQLVTTHRSIPDSYTGLVTPSLRDGPFLVPRDDRDPSSPLVASSFLPDGTQAPVLIAGSVPFVPGGRPGAALVDIADLTRIGWQGNSQAHLLVYAATGEAARLAGLRRDLAAHGLPVTGVRTTAAEANAFGESSAAWSLRLAVAVALVGLLVAGLGLLVLVASSWRARTRDLAGLRLLGLRPAQVRRVAAEDVAPTVLSAVVGAACGIVGGVVAMPLVPLFLEPSRVLARDDGAAWGSTTTGAVVAVVVLTAVAAVAALRVARHSVVQRLRESE